MRRKRETKPWVSSVTLDPHVASAMRHQMAIEGRRHSAIIESALRAYLGLEDTTTEPLASGEETDQ